MNAGTASLKAWALALGLILSPSVWAAQYQVSVSATITNDLNYPVIFGIQAPTQVPVQFTFTIDTSLAQITTIPANTFINALPGSFSKDVQLIPKAAIKNAHITAGTTGSWTEADLTNGQFDNLQNYNVAIIGDLVAGPTGLILDVSNVASGELDLGGIQCPNSNACSFYPVGFATSDADGGLSDVANVAATISVVGSTAASDLSALMTTIQGSTNIKPAASKLLVDALNATAKLVAANKPKDAKIALLAFEVLADLEKAPVLKTGETAAQAMSFINSAKVINGEF
jgi:hypothetical protein